jgi:DGQHR domain-containing protein
VRDVGKLFLDLGFEAIAHKKKILGIGEIDLAFKLQRDGLLLALILEVSSHSYDQNRKIDHFLSRWSSPANLDVLLRELQMTGARNLRVYVDLSRNSDSDLASIRHHLGQADHPNHVLFKDDFEYFQSVAESIGQWAKSDLLSYLRIPMLQTALRINAIQFYLNDAPVFSFVCDVRTLLDACYISRRLGDHKGYQRALNQGRLRNIEKEIADRKIVAFPNSVLINCEGILTSNPAPAHDCPKQIEITLPTTYCSCCIVDGQHRLLGFSKLSETELSQRHLPVVAFQKLPLDAEVKMFIDINSKQKRIDSNLIEDLKADFPWDPSQNYREHSGSIIVLIARDINRNGPLRHRIYMGGAKETRQGKITLSTFVTVLRENQLSGGRGHFWQTDPAAKDIAEPLTKARSFFSSLLGIFHADTSTGRFLLGNVGLRIVFRTVQVLERNRAAGNSTIEASDLLQDMNQVLDDKMVKDLETLYGGGGGVEGSNRLIEALQKRFSNYKQLELDFRHLSRQNLRALLQ